MNTANRMTWAVVLLPLCAIAQVQGPPNSFPAGQSGLPTQSPALPSAGTRAGGDDCSRQSQAIREQFRIQEANVRRETADRTRLAAPGDKERIHHEAEQRLSALKLEAAEAQRRVMASCRG